jgi:hypothetical protein
VFSGATEAAVLAPTMSPTIISGGASASSSSNDVDGGYIAGAVLAGFFGMIIQISIKIKHPE